MVSLFTITRHFVVIERQQIVFISPRTAPHIFSFDLAHVNNLELLDPLGFEKALYTFCERNAIHNISYTGIAHDTFVLCTDLPDPKSNEKIDIYIPLPKDQAGSKIMSSDGKSRLYAYNATLIQIMLRVLTRKSCSVSHIIPSSLLPTYSPQIYHTYDYFQSLPWNTLSVPNNSLVAVPSKNYRSLMLTVGAVLLTVGVMLGAYYIILTSASQKKIQSPVAEKVVQKQIPTSTPTPLPISPDNVRIAVLNGSGKVGEARRLATLLNQKKYSVDTVDNAEGEALTTTIEYTPGIPNTFISSLQAVLEEYYQMSTPAAALSPTGTASANLVIIIGAETARE